MTVELDNLFLESFTRPDPIDDDKRRRIEKIRDQLLSLFREGRYIGSALYQQSFPPFTYDLCHRKIQWKKGSKALCVLVHGLRGDPVIWVEQKKELEKHPHIDTFIPLVPKRGNCSLEEAAAPLLPPILDYVAQNPGNPVCLLGVSNGSRIVHWLELQLREYAPQTPVKVSTIAAVHFGSSLVNRLETVGMAGLLLNTTLRKELAYGSQTAKDLLQKILQPLPPGTAERSYEFYASPDDYIVPDIRSSLPRLGRNETFHIVPGHGHNSIVAAVATQQINSCVEWIAKHQSKT